MSRADVSDPEIKAAIAKVKNASDATNFLVLTYVPKSDIKLKVSETGSGGFSELFDELNDGRSQFCLLEMKIANISKYVYIGWCGEGVTGMKKGFFANHSRDVAKAIGGFHLEITARSEADVKEADIKAKLTKATGANYDAGSKTNRGDKLIPTSVAQGRINATKSNVTNKQFDKSDYNKTDEGHKFWAQNQQQKKEVTRGYDANSVAQQRQQFKQQQQQAPPPASRPAPAPAASAPPPVASRAPPVASRPPVAAPPPVPPAPEPEAEEWGEEPAQEEQWGEEPAQQEEQWGEEPAQEEQWGEEPAQEEQWTEEPAQEEQWGEEPAQEEQYTEEPAQEEQWGEEPAAEEQYTEDQGYGEETYAEDQGGEYTEEQGGEYPTCTAQYDYEGENADDLPFYAGDVISVLDQSDPSGWWQGQLGDKTGFFPSNFVTMN